MVFAEKWLRIKTTVEFFPEKVIYSVLLTLLKIPKLLTKEDPKASKFSGTGLNEIFRENYNSNGRFSKRLM